MSGKVSAASSAGSSANIASGKAAPAAATGGAAGHAGSDGVGAAPAARGSAAGSAGHFSGAMADAARPGGQARLSNLRDRSVQADADANSDSAQGASGASAQSARGMAAAEVTGDAGPGLTAGVLEASASAVPVLSQGVVNLKTSTSGTGRAAGGGASKGASVNASTVPSDPVVLAMLLAESGMPPDSGAAAGAAAHGGRAAAADAGDAGEASVAMNAAAGNVSTGPATADLAHAAGPLPAPDLVATTDTAPAGDAGNNISTVAASAQQARAVPAPLIDAAGSSAAAAQAKSGTAQGPGAQPSIVTDAAGLPALMRSLPGGATQTPAAEATISVPLTNGSWPQAVAAQVHWFVNNDVQSATLRLSPEHLGPVEVHIDVRDSQVNVNFSAAHAETRAALEQTVPRLREIFASSGLSLGQANVQQHARPGSQSSANPLRSAIAHAQSVEPVALAAGQGLGLIDEYA
jgi:flagellar hook-length control protein FliK